MAIVGQSYGIRFLTREKVFDVVYGPNNSANNIGLLLGNWLETTAPTCTNKLEWYTVCSYYTVVSTCDCAKYLQLIIII